jgi:hypothetical protein
MGSTPFTSQFSKVQYAVSKAVGEKDNVGTRPQTFQRGYIYGWSLLWAAVKLSLQLLN